jgi:hypothetical protein
LVAEEGAGVVALSLLEGMQALVCGKSEGMDAFVCDVRGNLHRPVR